jgi:hypothetical protein
LLDIDWHNNGFTIARYRYLFDPAHTKLLGSDALHCDVATVIEADVVVRGVTNAAVA